MAITVTVPYEDYKNLVKDAADKVNVIRLLETEFDSADCQLTAVKAILNIEETAEEENPEPPIIDDSQEGDSNE